MIQIQSKIRFLISWYTYVSVLIFMATSFISCAQTDKNTKASQEISPKIVTGAERMNEYVPILKGKRVGLLVNQTSRVKKAHLLDTLIASGIEVTKVFAPEHGFRGDQADGEVVKDGKDSKTGLPVISLYGSNKRPKDSDMLDLDVVIYDIQDVGARFYTFISAMHYMMEAAATNGVTMMILDRPNPHGDYVDGPIWELEKPAYVGMHPIPIVYGMTAGELARMIKQERWMKGADKLKLEVIKMSGWDHKVRYTLPTKPSPNLPNDQAIALYPSLCLFEGTVVSVGRGTYDAFQIVGIPDSTAGTYRFTPRSIEGMSKYPKFQDQECYGLDLRQEEALRKIDLSYLIKFYEGSKNKDGFFKKYFTTLAGSPKLQKQIEQGMTAEEIRASWTMALDNFKAKRKKYLLYTDFE